MQLQTVTINNKDLGIKEYQGQRVVTFKDVDIVHDRVEGTAKRNFTDNRQHFIYGEDYFKVCPNEIRSNKIMDMSPKLHQDVVFLTESGYLMLVKSFTDDLAWEVQRQLVNTYFKVKEKEKQLQYPPKSTSVGEIARLVGKIDAIAKDRKNTAYERAIIADGICKQFGIKLHESFIKEEPVSLQLTLIGVFNN